MGIGRLCKAETHGGARMFSRGGCLARSLCLYSSTEEQQSRLSDIAQINSRHLQPRHAFGEADQPVFHLMHHLRRAGMRVLLHVCAAAATLIRRKHGEAGSYKPHAVGRFRCVTCVALPPATLAATSRSQVPQRAAPAREGRWGGGASLTRVYLGPPAVVLVDAAAVEGQADGAAPLSPGIRRIVAGGALQQRLLGAVVGVPAGRGTRHMQ